VSETVDETCDVFGGADTIVFDTVATVSVLTSYGDVTVVACAVAVALSALAGDVCDVTDSSDDSEGSLKTWPAASRTEVVLVSVDTLSAEVVCAVRRHRTFHRLRSISYHQSKHLLTIVGA
jgi:hypothetical protein